MLTMGPTPISHVSLNLSPVVFWIMKELLFVLILIFTLMSLQMFLPQISLTFQQRVSGVEMNDIRAPQKWSRKHLYHPLVAGCRKFITFGSSGKFEGVTWKSVYKTTDQHVSFPLVVRLWVFLHHTARQVNPEQEPVICCCPHLTCQKQPQWDLHEDLQWVSQLQTHFWTPCSESSEGNTSVWNNPNHNLAISTVSLALLVSGARHDRWMNK